MAGIAVVSVVYAAGLCSYAPPEGELVRRPIFFFLVAIGWACPATAGLIANFRNAEDASTMKVEASDAGDAKLEYSNQLFYLIVTGGQAYIIYTVTPDPQVTRIADLEKVMGEVRPSVELHTPVLDKATIVPAGTATVAGYSGKAYVLRYQFGTSTRPALVVSHDPKLRALGVPLARQMDFSIATLRLSGKPVSPNFLRLRELIGDGTALIFAGYRLESIKTSRVDPKEFELPGEPLSIDVLRRNAQAALKRRQ